MTRQFLQMMVGCILSLACSSAQAYERVTLPLKQLPEEHEYQKGLRVFMATLTARDFEVDRKEITAVPAADPQGQYRLWLLGLHPPTVAVAALPAEDFTLAKIESQEGLRLPADTSTCQMSAWLAHWDYPGNPYHGSRALKLRAFVLAAVDTAMLDYLYEHNPQGANRSDYLGGNLIWIGYTFGVVRDVLPPEAAAAFEAGIKKLVVAHLNKWGPTGAMTDMDLFAPVGLWYISRATTDPEVKQVAEAYSRKLFTDEHYFHQAGYFVDNGCFDTSYNGISLYFAAWAALMSDWKFTQEAVDKAFRLRAHLCFPDPDGGLTGPSAMSSRTSGDSPHDQWQFPHRPYAAAMVTDEALYTAPLPEKAKMESAPASLAASLNNQLSKPVEPTPQKWSEGHWSGSINFAYEQYRDGYYPRRLALEAQGSPLLKPLYQREGTFVREFALAFTIARLGGYAAAIHTGPVGRPVGHGGRPYGFGGGAMAVFWTPESGAVIATRRRGVQGAVYDSISEWRLWPVHAVSGITAKGEILSSSRIERPEVATDIGEARGTVRASGVIPKYNPEQTAAGPSGLTYERTFSLDASGLGVTTNVRSDGTESLAELYETIPLFLRENDGQQPATIQFLAGGNWVEATAQPAAAVEAIRILRFRGGAVIRFKRPRNVRLSPQVWRDGFQTQAECRTVLVDLLDHGQIASAPGVPSIEYTIQPAEASKEPEAPK